MFNVKFMTWLRVYTLIDDILSCMEDWGYAAWWIVKWAAGYNHRQASHKFKLFILRWIQPAVIIHLYSDIGAFSTWRGGADNMKISLHRASVPAAGGLPQMQTLSFSAS